VFADGYESLRTRHYEREGDELALFTYGSLIVRREIARVFRMRRLTVRPVRVRGLRRAFSVCIARWLEDPPEGRTGVLNLHRDRSTWCNGLLLRPVSPEGFEAYARREFGYRLCRVDTNRVEYYGPGERALPEGVSLYTCRVDDRHTDEGLGGYPSYRARCLRGARSWGESFYRDFLASTHARGRTLREQASDGDLRTP